jgi:hypothetical protein
MVPVTSVPRAIPQTARLRMKVKSFFIRKILKINNLE